MLNILLIDDNKADREFLTKAAQKDPLPISLETASGGLEGLSKLRSEKPMMPGIVLLDINMPKFDGWWTLEEIKGDSSIKETPVIIFTTSENPEDVRTAYLKGACCYVSKPCGMRDTISCLKSLCSFMEYVLLPADETHMRVP